MGWSPFSTELVRTHVPVRFSPFWGVGFGEVVDACSDPGVDEELDEGEGCTPCICAQGEGRGGSEDDIQEIVGIGRDTNEQQEVRVCGDDLEEGHGGWAGG